MLVERFSYILIYCLYSEARFGAIGLL